MRAPIRDRLVRNRENRCPEQELHPHDPILERAVCQLRMRFALQLSAPDSGAVHKRTSACSEKFFPVQPAVGTAWANAFLQPKTQDHRLVGCQACCEAFRCKHQSRWDCSFCLCERSAGSATDRIDRESRPEQMCPSRRR